MRSFGKRLFVLNFVLLSLFSTKSIFMYNMSIYLSIDKGFITYWLCLEKTGEPFSQEEMNEMLTALADQDNNLVYYKDFISQLTVDAEV